MRRALLVGLGVLVAIQLVPVSRDNGPGTVDAVEAPPEVTALLRRVCANCHSGATEWPWYSRVAPVSWLVADDVRIGRQQLNFSEWGRYSARQAENKLEEICAVVQAEAMPPKKYTLAHPQAKLTAVDVKAVCAWTVAEQQRLTAQK